MKYMHAQAPDMVKISPTAKTQRNVTRAARPEEPEGPSVTGFPVVGIGCSASGLEALEKFLRNVPPGSGMAFVVVQHLDPLHVSALPGLLQRFTAMRVVEVEDGMAVVPDAVFVIPPNKDLSLLHGRLRLLEPFAPLGLRLPINFFLRSLAEDRQELLIGVVAVLCTLIFKESQVATHDGRWYRVRIMPYRTFDNMIDGVVITFTDITMIKQPEAQLRERGY